MQGKKISSLLIGNRYNSNKKFQDVLIGRKQGFSRLIAGRFIDSDKDKIPNITDCEPFNRKYHADIPPELQALRPQIPQTVAQMRQARTPQEIIITQERPLIEQEIKAQEEKYYQEQGKIQSQQVEADLQRAKQNIETYKQQVENAQKNKNPNAVQSALDRLTLAEERYSGLQSIQGLAQTGQYNYADLKSYAEGQAGYKFERIKYRESLPKTTTITTITGEPPKSYTDVNKRALDIGMKPVYSNGKLLGYSDLANKVTVIPSALNEYLKTREQDIKARSVGLIPVTDIKSGTRYYTDPIRKIDVPAQNIDKIISNQQKIETPRSVIESYKGIIKPYRDKNWFDRLFKDKPEYERDYTYSGTGIFNTKTKQYEAPMRVRPGSFTSLQLQEIINPESVYPVEVLYQREAEKVSNKINKELLKKYQDTITKGELTELEAQKLYEEEANKMFSEEFDESIESSSFKEKLKETKKFREGYAKYEESTIAPTEKLKSIGKSTGEFAISITPGLNVVYGARQYVKAQETIKSEPGAILGLSPFQEEVEAKAQEYQKTAGSMFLAAGLSAVSKPFIAARAVTSQRILDLQGAKVLVKGEELAKSSDAVILRLIGTQKTTSGEAVTRVTIPIKAKEGSQVAIGIGKGETQFAVEDFLGTLRNRGQPVYIKGTQTFTTAAQAEARPTFIKTMFGNIPLERTTTSIGSGYIAPTGKDKIIKFRFGGVSKEYDKFYATVGGRQIKLLIREAGYKPRQVQIVNGKILPIPQRTSSIKVGLSQAGYIKKLPEDNAIKFIYSGGRKTTEQITKQTTKAPSGFMEALTEKATKLVTSPTIPLVSAEEKIVDGGVITSQGSKLIQQESKATPTSSIIQTEPKASSGITGRSIYAGTGQYERTEGVSIDKLQQQSKVINLMVNKDLIQNKEQSMVQQQIQLKKQEKVKKQELGKILLLNQNLMMNKDLNMIKKMSMTQLNLLKQEATQKQVSKQITIPSVSFPGELIPTNFPFEMGGGFGIPRLPERKKKFQEQQPYDAYVLIDATKGNKKRWIQVADNVPRETALGIGAGFVDQSNISSRFKIVRDKGKVNPVKSNAWSNIAFKFRDYLVRKGTKIQNQNTYIEKQKYRLDSPAERRQIQSARSLLIGRAR